MRKRKSRTQQEMAGAKAGREANRSARGRGIAIHAHGSQYTRHGKTYSGGHSGKGLLNYVLGKASAEIVFTNTGSEVSTILSDFTFASSRRPDITKRVGHLSLSLPATTNKLTAIEWDAVIEIVREQLGLMDFSAMAVRHGDTDHNHVHFVYSRISDAGKVFDDRFLKLRLAALEDVIEARFNLPLTPKPASSLPNYSQGEAAIAAKTGLKPPRLIIAEAIREAVTGKPDAAEFVQRLAASEITARANIAPSTGKMSGYSFSYQGIAFKGSAVGAKWSTLRMEIKDEPHSNTEKLTDHRVTTDAANANLPRYEPPTPYGVEEPIIAVTDAAARKSPQRAAEISRNDSRQTVQSNRRKIGGPTQRSYQAVGRIGVGNVGNYCGGGDSDYSNFYPSHLNLTGEVIKWHSKSHRYPAYFSGKSTKPIAYGRWDEGIIIPRPMEISDEQLAELLKIVNQGSSIRISGSATFCQRAAQIAERLGIEHDQPRVSETHDTNPTDLPMTNFEYEVAQTQNFSI